MKKQTILLVDKEKLLLEFIQQELSDNNYNVITASNAKEGFDILEKQEVNMVISDYEIPKIDGLEFLKKVKITHPDILTIMITEQADIDLAIKAINEAGVYKFILKPWDDIKLKTTIKRALELLQVIKERDGLSQKVKSHETILKELEKRYPGITKIERDEDGYILSND
ncbi:MAG: response regulator [Desulfobacterales bacterium]